MQSSAQERYLSTEVMTAAPQKLQLMLIEAAIRSARRARQKWQANEDDEACEALIHAQDVVGELMASLNAEVDPKLVKKVASVYLFVFRSLMEANYQRDEEKLNDAVRVLEIERETWKQVCEQLGSQKDPQNGATGPTAQPPGAALPSTEPPGATIVPDLPALPSDAAANRSAGSGLSLEA